MNNTILALSGVDIKHLFNGKEKDVISLIKKAYIAHEDGNDILPYSSFLRFPKNEKDRIIALPAYLGGDFEIAGIKWISSFPNNLSHGENRASAVLILNSMKDGKPAAILEGSKISAVRTAASAALASTYLHTFGEIKKAGIIGCGPINYEIVHYLHYLWPELKTLYIYDLSPERSEFFREKCKLDFNLENVVFCKNVKEVYNAASLISFATTSASPYINELECNEKKLILHISLRDLSPNIILNSCNITDDINHVCRAQTSLHLAGQLIGNNSFIKGTLGEIIEGKIKNMENNKENIIFSPFGLGILDIAIGNYLYHLALKHKMGVQLPFFEETQWI